MHVDLGQEAPAVAAGVAAIAVAALLWRERRSRSAAWRIICVALPGAAAVFALLAAADVQLSGAGDTSRVVILLDESASARHAAWRDPQWVRRLAAARLGDAAHVTVVGFDDAAHLLLTDVGVISADAGRWPTAWQGFGEAPASRLAAAAQWRDGSSDNRPRWLLSDGLLDLSAAPPVAGATLLPPTSIDLGISDLRVSAGEVRVRVTASAAASGIRVTLLRDGVAIGGTEIALQAGAARWIGVPVQPGSAAYEARVALPGNPDLWPEDDVARLWHTEPAAPRVLSVHTDSAFPHDPWTLAADGWQVIDLHNAAVNDLSPDQWRTLDAFVRDTGGGLIFSGPQEFGPGSYAHNPVAQALLPVSSVQTDGPAARVAFLLDASASMNSDAPGGERRETLALRGVTAALPMLQPRDRVAVVTFNDAARIVEAGSQEELMQRPIPAVEAAGGTNPDAALAVLGEALAGADGPGAVVLLTDGEVPHADAAAWKRTLSDLGAKLAIIAPPTAHTGALAALLAQTGGVWLDGTPSDWARMLADAVEQTGIRRSGKTRSSGVADDGTPVGEFAETWPRPEGRILHFVTDAQGHRWPLEAQAQRGLGRVVAYVAEPAPTVHERLVSEAAAEEGDRRFSIRAQRSAGSWQVVVDGVQGETFVNGATLNVRSASGSQPLLQVAPGRYEAAVADPRGAVVTEGSRGDERLVGRVEAAEIGAGHPAEWPALSVAVSHLPGADEVSGDPATDQVWRVTGEAWRWVLWPWFAGAAAAAGMAALGGRRRGGMGVRTARS